MAERARLKSPIGMLEIRATKTHVTSVTLARAKGKAVAAKHGPVMSECILQLKEYFAGKRARFELPLDPQGTPFQKLAWYALTCIENGTLASYGQVAKAIGNPGAVRAVGTACGKNPLLLLVPCHRVISGDGRLGGFSSGLKVKKWLLKHEDAPMPE